MNQLKKQEVQRSKKKERDYAREIRTEKYIFFADKMHSTM